MQLEDQHREQTPPSLSDWLTVTSLCPVCYLSICFFQTANITKSRPVTHGNKAESYLCHTHTHAHVLVPSFISVGIPRSASAPPEEDKVVMETAEFPG